MVSCQAKVFFVRRLPARYQGLVFSQDSPVSDLITRRLWARRSRVPESIRWQIYHIPICGPGLYLSTSLYRTRVEQRINSSPMRTSFTNRLYIINVYAPANSVNKMLVVSHTCVLASIKQTVSNAYKFANNCINFRRGN